MDTLSYQFDLFIITSKSPEKSAAILQNKIVTDTDAADNNNNSKWRYERYDIVYHIH